jgi:choline dehydrogenase-like flavoprotein
MSDYDVIIIGTGAGGGTLARHLAPSGKRILLLERGDWLRREPQNWLAQDVFVENRYVSPDTWYDAEGKPFQPQFTIAGGENLPERSKRCFHVPESYNQWRVPNVSSRGGGPSGAAQLRARPR